MPELPEVETVRRTLIEGGLVGRRIVHIAVLHGDVVRHPSIGAFVAGLQGKRLTDIGRRGKYLLLEVEDRVLVAHLRMTGRLWLSAPDAEKLSHTHLVLDLDDGRQLRFRDVRRFGGFHLLEGPDDPAAPQGLRELGPEPDAVTLKQLAAACARHERLAVKGLLLDQRVVAGLGNIYVDEALHRARVHPRTTCGSLSSKDRARIAVALREVLQEALANRGTTFLDFRDGSGEPGAFQEFLRVYRREGLPCRTCGEPIAKTRVAGRGTHYCPNCQKGDGFLSNTAPTSTKTRSRPAKTSNASKPAR
ncbi:MAG: bifunctional DNA-formamidopyrimidine glycosylase/DNA-(apurinic or apyrimidinic site) lyase [Thermaerobacter sp.]|nr:bifunctional DNA-formamidopyrimidine glycosylase/DNA-(apurinic or apyrimidinic site) lyase [Thermaerobacter sp.]